MGLWADSQQGYRGGSGADRCSTDARMIMGFQAVVVILCTAFWGLDGFICGVITAVFIELSL